MRETATDKHRSGCPISIALETFGDTWSLLIVRDLMFKNRRTFNDFLGAEEQIATNILSDRLAQLQAQGIIGKRRDPADGRGLRMPKRFVTPGRRGARASAIVASKPLAGSSPYWSK